MLLLNLIIGAGALQGLLLAAVLLALSYRRKHPALKWLGGFVAAFSLTLLSDVLLQTRAILEVPFLYQVFDFLIFWFGPLCFGYVRHMLGKPLKPGFWLHLQFLPGWLLLGILLPGILQSPSARQAEILSDLAILSSDGPPDILILCVGLQVLAYLLAALWQMRQYWLTLESQYSNAERYKLRWLMQLLGFCGVLWCLWMISILWQLRSADIAAQFGLAMGVYALGYRGMRQPRLWRNPANHRSGEQVLAPALEVEPSIHLPSQAEISSHSPSPRADSGIDLTAASLPAAPEKLSTAKYAKAGISAETMASIADSLEAQMRQEMSFLEPELSLSDLAKRLAVSPHTLSQTLNVHFGQSFFEYINTFRTKEVQRCFADPAYDSQSILEIALQSGFASKATFNATFKRLAGQTPSASRASLASCSAND